MSVAPKQETIGGDDSEAERKGLAVGAFFYIGGEFLVGMGFWGTMAGIHTGDRAQLFGGGVLGLIGTVLIAWGLLLCRAGFPSGLRHSFRRTFTIGRVMLLIAAVAVFLALPGELIEFLLVWLFVILAVPFLFWPILLCIYANCHGEAV